MDGVQSTAPVQQYPSFPSAGSQGSVTMDGGSKPTTPWQQPSANGAPAAAQASLSMPQNGAGPKSDGADAAAPQTGGEAGGKNGLTVAGSGIVPVLQ
jgi:hypothetical protein